MEDIAILDLQHQVRGLSSQMAEMKEAMKESPCFESSLDPNH